METVELKTKKIIYPFDKDSFSEAFKAAQAVKNNDLGYNILAIDPATNLGWASSFSDFGVFNLSQKKNMSDGYKWLKLENWLLEKIELLNVKAISIELPITMHQGATIHHSKLNAVIELQCAKNNIQYTTFSPTAVKKFATGIGNAKKDAMIASAAKFLSYKGDDDNEADALWMLAMLKKDLLNL